MVLHWRWRRVRRGASWRAVSGILAAVQRRGASPRHDDASRRRATRRQSRDAPRRGPESSSSLVSGGDHGGPYASPATPLSSRLPRRPRGLCDLPVDAPATPRHHGDLRAPLLLRGRGVRGSSLCRGPCAGHTPRVHRPAAGRLLRPPDAHVPAGGHPEQVSRITAQPGSRAWSRSFTIRKR